MTDNEIDQEVIKLNAYCLYVAEILAWNAMIDINSGIIETGWLLYFENPNYKKCRVLSYQSWKEYYVYDEI